MGIHRLVKSTGYHLSFHGSIHIGHFFRTLTDQRHNLANLWIGDADGIGDILQDSGLARFWRRNDHGTLPAADWSHQVDHAGGQIERVILQAKKFVRENWCQVFESWSFAGFIRSQSIDGFHFEQTVVALRFTRRSDEPDNKIARSQLVTAQQRLRNIHIIRTDAIVCAQKADALIHNLKHATAHLETFGFAKGLSNFNDQPFTFKLV